MRPAGPTRPPGAVMTPDLRDLDLRPGEPGRAQGFVYARGHNPTRVAFEGLHRRPGGAGRRRLASPRGWPPPADRAGAAELRRTIVLADGDLLRWTYRLFERGRRRLRRASDFSYVKSAALDAVEAAHPAHHADDMGRDATNPTLALVDLGRSPAIGKRAGSSRRGQHLASPCASGPLELARPGLPLVTKYLNGHSDSSRRGDRARTATSAGPAQSSCRTRGAE
jgi:cystathionine beta-lyase/cystathionine gamma-synthase